jgi:DNA-binding response OmpR family regulator
MIVEPEVVARMVVGEYLRECGYRVIEGMSAADVWSVLDNGVTLDVLLVHVSGNVDGFMLARQVRDRNPNIDVILTSGVAKVADKAGTLCEEGPLEKPYHPREVVRRIQLLRERRRAEGRGSPGSE